MIADWVQGHAPYFIKFTNKLIERDWSLITKKAMTDNARHGEWLAEMERLNIPLHSTFYCFIKLLVNHAFTSFKPFHLFRISQAYIYNSALSCIIRVTAASDHPDTAELLSDILSPTATYLLYCNFHVFTSEYLITFFWKIRLWRL